MQSPLKGSGPTLHKCYAVLTLWTNHPVPPSQHRVLIIRFPRRDYVAMQEAVPGPKRHFAAPQHTVAFGRIATISTARKIALS
jgi:hypothetical protein